MPRLSHLSLLTMRGLCPLVLCALIVFGVSATHNIEASQTNGTQLHIDISNIATGHDGPRASGGLSGSDDGSGGGGGGGDPCVEACADIIGVDIILPTDYSNRPMFEAAGVASYPLESYPYSVHVPNNRSDVFEPRVVPDINLAPIIIRQRGPPPSPSPPPPPPPPPSPPPPPPPIRCIFDSRHDDAQCTTVYHVQWNVDGDEPPTSWLSEDKVRGLDADALDTFSRMIVGDALPKTLEVKGTRARFKKNHLEGRFVRLPASVWPTYTAPSSGFWLGQIWEYNAHGGFNRRRWGVHVMGMPGSRAPRRANPTMWWWINL